jgi:hypothetical protein
MEKGRIEDALQTLEIIHRTPDLRLTWRLTLERGQLPASSPLAYISGCPILSRKFTKGWVKSFNLRVTEAHRDC